MAKPAVAARTRKKTKRTVVTGMVHIKATFNNTHVLITDPRGDKLSSQTSGGANFKGSRKSTPYAAQVAAQTAAQTARDDYGLKAVDVRIQGPGPGREAAVRAISALGIKILSIADVTGIPHNGCRPEKERRV